MDYWRIFLACRILAMKTEEVKSPPLEEVKYQTLTVKEIQSLRSESSDAPSVNVSKFSVY